MADPKTAATSTDAPKSTAQSPEFTMPERLVSPDSWVGHIPFAMWLIKAFKPKRFVELGVHTGNSYCAIAQTVQRFGTGTECFGVDHWLGDPQAGHYGEDIYADLTSWHDVRYRHFSRLLRMSFEDALNHVEDRSVDLLHIDGLHTYEAVRTDFETWHPKLSDRSIVLFHDTNVYSSDFGVWEYWKEISAKYPTFEFLHSNGLGVAYTGTLELNNSGFSAEIQSLFEAARSPEVLGATRDYFAHLGNAVKDCLNLKETRRGAEMVARDLKEINHDRMNVRKDRDHWKERAQIADNWERLALYCHDALGINLDDVTEAFRKLYNSGNPTAMRDRQFLQKSLSTLVQKGTLEVPAKEVLRQEVVRLIRRVQHSRSKTTDDAPGMEDPIFVSIRKEGLFDEQFYALTHDAKQAGYDPLEHYFEIGESKGVQPSALFDPDYYARRYPDVSATGYGLLRHYAQFGRDEGRNGLPPAQRLTLTERSGSSERPCVLIMLHEASRTGAPILGWNLAQKLSSSHDVVVYFKKGGELREAFEHIQCTVIEQPHEDHILKEDVFTLSQKLADTLKPDFVITNSADTREYIPGLVASGVGVVSLIHEFSVYVRPRNSAYDILAWAHQVVFPAHVVYSSFAEEYPYLAHRNYNILPQGVPALPQGIEASFGSEVYSEEIRTRLRPRGHENSMLIVGMGRIQFRKGTDLFVMAAQAAMRAQPDAQLRFVWIGGGLDPNDTHEFPSVLTDLLSKTGLGDRFEVIGEVENMDEVYRQADILALTSRLDPMPNTAIEAMTNGIPVVSFNQSSGISELLLKESKTAHLVVDNLDVSAMGSRILELYANRAQNEELRDTIRTIAQSAFDMDRYVSSLVALGQEAQEAAKATVHDTSVIAVDKDNFDPETFLGSQNVASMSHDEALTAYLIRNRIAAPHREMRSLTGLRRPLPGFNPQIYLEDVLSWNRDADPLAHWIENGRPMGRWTPKTISLHYESKDVPVNSTVLHGHFFYTELAQDFLERLNKNTLRCDLVLTTTDEDRASLLRDMLQNYDKGRAEVRVVPNAGRDIGAFLTGLKDILSSSYDIIGHIHGKKSLRLNSDGGDTWREFLWEHLVGGRTAAADQCVQALSEDRKLGVIFPCDANLCGWDENLTHALEITRQLGRKEPLPEAFEWPIGTMFWARREALEPLLSLELDWQDYPAEPVGEDGTMLHALERLIPFFAEQAGLSYALTHLEGVQR